MKIDDLGDAIQRELEHYASETTEIVFDLVDEVTEAGVEKLKVTSPKRSGRYARAWKAKTTIESSTGKTKTIHNGKGQLTHLLENGHAKQNGGRVSGQPHIAPVEEEVIASFEKGLQDRL